MRSGSPRSGAIACSRQFYSDLGLAETCFEWNDGGSFVTLDGARVNIRSLAAPDLAPSFEPGSTIREVIWGCRDEIALAETIAPLSAG